MTYSLLRHEILRCAQDDRQTLLSHGGGPFQGDCRLYYAGVFQGGNDMPDARVSNTITGRDAFLRVLGDEGVTKMFGNPGTTELPIMHALSTAPEMGYVLGLQEAVVIAMADGYARASGK